PRTPLIYPPSRHDALPSLEQLHGPRPALDGARGIAQGADEHQAHDEGQHERRSADRHGDTRTDEGVILHRDRERGTADGWARRQRRCSHDLYRLGVLSRARVEATVVSPRAPMV